MPAPMNPAPSTPALFTGRGFTDGSLTPGSRASRFFMKKMPIRLAAIGEPASSPNAFCSALSPSSSVLLQPSRIAFKATSGAGYCPLVLALMAPSATANANFSLVGVQAERPGESLAPRLPLAALLQQVDQPASFFDQFVGRDGVERESDGDGLLTAERSSPAQITSMAAFRPIKRGSRCVPPQPGRMPIWTSGRLIWVWGAVETSRSSMVRTSSVPPPKAAAVDQGDRRKRQPADPIEKLVARGDQGRYLLARGVAHHGQLVQVGAGDELARLAAPEQKPAQVGPLFQLADQAGELEQHFARQRVDLLVGEVEGDEADLAFELLDSECILHDLSLR